MSTMATLESTCRNLEKVGCVLEDRRKKVGNYLLDKTLGEGSFGKVRLGTHVLAKEKVAVKVITKKATLQREYLQDNLRREAIVLQRLCHPNVVHLYEVMETENGYYMVLELARGGEFAKYLSARKQLDEMETRKFMRQLISAVDHIHRSGIVHRDLKLGNFLLDENMNIKIIDFGLSNFHHDNALSTQCGSPAFTAPEVYSKQKYGCPVDIWSLGVNMFIMLTSRLPFETTSPSNLTQLYAAMLRGCSVPQNISTECQHILKRMLDPRDTSRVTARELFTDPWLTESSKNRLTPVLPLIGNCNRTISEEAVDYILKTVKISPHDLRLALHSSKPNSVAAIHDLLEIRLKKGLGLPVPASEAPSQSRSSCGQEPALLNGNNNTVTTTVIQSARKACLLCANQDRGTLGSKEDNSILDTMGVCWKCGKPVGGEENAMPILDQILQFQKLLPLFQELNDKTQDRKDSPWKGSGCSDIVSLLNNVDDETFERALKMLRGYGSLSNPPAPPNSASNEGQLKQMAKESCSNRINERMCFQKQFSPRTWYDTGSNLEQRCSSRNRRLGINTMLNVLPPIEAPVACTSQPSQGETRNRKENSENVKKELRLKAVKDSPRYAVTNGTCKIKPMNDTIQHSLSFDRSDVGCNYRLSKSSHNQTSRWSSGDVGKSKGRNVVFSKNSPANILESRKTVR